MFDNIGEKIQEWAGIMCGLGIIGSVITAIVLWIQDSYYDNTFILGVVVLVVGCFGSWITCSVMYAFGEITRNSEQQAILMNQLCEETDEREPIAAPKSAGF